MNPMNTIIPITDIKVRVVDDGSDGLLAWASCVVSNSIKLDNIAIRRGRDGSLFLTYPTKQSSKGPRHPYFHPITPGAAKTVEDAVLTRLASLARLSGETSTGVPPKP